MVVPPVGGADSTARASVSMVRRQVDVVRPSRSSCSHVSHDVATSSASRRSRPRPARRASSSGAKVARSWLAERTPGCAPSSAATVGELRSMSSAERRTGAVAWNTVVALADDAGHALGRPGSVDVDGPHVAPVALFLDPRRRRARIDSRSSKWWNTSRSDTPARSRDAPGRGLGVALLEQADQGLGQGPAGALAPSHPPVAGLGLDDRHHRPILRNLHSECKKFRAGRRRATAREPGRRPGAVVSRSVRAMVCRELGSLDNVVVEERATPRPGTGTGGRGRARRRRELRRRAHLPGPVPDEAGRPLRAGRGDRRCGECGGRRRHQRWRSGTG